MQMKESDPAQSKHFGPVLPSSTTARGSRNLTTKVVPKTMTKQKTSSDDISSGGVLGTKDTTVTQQSSDGKDPIIYTPVEHDLLGASTVNLDTSDPKPSELKPYDVHTSDSEKPLYLSGALDDFDHFNPIATAETRTGDMELKSGPQCVEKDDQFISVRDIRDLREIKKAFESRCFDFETVKDQKDLYQLAKALNEFRRSVYHCYTKAAVIMYKYVIPLECDPLDLNEDEMNWLFDNVYYIFEEFFSFMFTMEKSICGIDLVKNDIVDYSDLSEVVKTSDLVHFYVEFVKSYHLRDMVMKKINSGAKQYARVNSFLKEQDAIPLFEKGDSVDTGDIDKCDEKATKLADLFDHLFQDPPKLAHSAERIVALCKKAGLSKLRTSFEVIQEYFDSFNKEVQQMKVHKQFADSIIICLIYTLESKKRYTEAMKKRLEGLKNRVFITFYKTRANAFILYEDLLIVTSSVDQIELEMKRIQFKGRTIVDIIKWCEFDVSDFRVDTLNPNYIKIFDGIVTTPFIFRESTFRDSLLDTFRAYQDSKKLFEKKCG